MSEVWIDRLDTREAVLEHLNRLIDATDEMFITALSEQRLPAFEDALRRVRDEGALTLVLLYDDHTDEPVPEYDLDGLGTIIRHVDSEIPLIALSDGERGLQGHPWMLTDNTNGKQVTAFRSNNLCYGVLGQFITSHWALGEEVYTHEPMGLPHTFAGFRHAVVQAVFHLRKRRRVQTTATVVDPNDDSRVSTVEGTIVNARQNIVSPITSNFSGEASLTLEVGDEYVTLGGPGAFLEDYVAKSVTLERVH